METNVRHDCVCAHCRCVTKHENLEQTFDKKVPSCSTYNNVVRRLDLLTGQTSTLAGPGNFEDPRGANGVGTGMKISQPRALAITPDGKGVIIADASNTIRAISSSGSDEYDMATTTFTACPMCPEGKVSKAAGSFECEEVRPSYGSTFQSVDLFQITV
jgi:hypothetical protein